MAIVTTIYLYVTKKIPLPPKKKYQAILDESLVMIYYLIYSLSVGNNGSWIFGELVFFFWIFFYDIFDAFTIVFVRVISL